MAQIINGKAVSAETRAAAAAEVKKLAELGIKVSLAVVLVGNDPASAVYVRNKERACEEIGVRSVKYLLPEETTQEEAVALAMADEKISAELSGKNIVKQIYVKGKILNIVAK